MTIFKKATILQAGRNIGKQFTYTPFPLIYNFFKKRQKYYTLS
jgi:hypothetical protein